MRSFYILITILFLFSCKTKEADLSSDTVIKPNQFVAAFELLENGLSATDSNILKLADTITINPNLLARFMPDSIINLLTLGEKKTSFHPIGRIDKPTETYLILLCLKNKKPLITVLVLDKKNNFIASKDLFDATDNKSLYKYSININKEPTFFITREKLVNDKEVKYTKVGWAFTGKNFVTVVKETNERDEKLTAILNPIDTFAKLNLYSGNYVQDERNFISIRDGRTKQDYLFFLHIDKNEGLCDGELKGEMHLTDSLNAVYSLGGDPCVIDFIFDKNIITIKEKGSCGNRRGMDCLFDDAYTKIKEIKKKIIKPQVVKIPVANVAKMLMPTKPKLGAKVVTKPTSKAAIKAPLIFAPKAVIPKTAPPKTIKNIVPKPATVTVEKNVTDNKIPAAIVTPKITNPIDKTVIKKPAKTAPKPTAKPTIPVDENPYSNK